MKFTKELIEKAATCKSTDELLVLAKEEGFNLTLEDAQKYLAQLTGSELKLGDIEAVSGGCGVYGCAQDCTNPCTGYTPGPCYANA